MKTLAAILAMSSMAYQALPESVIQGDIVAAGNLRISQQSKDLILYYETGGQAYYSSRLERLTVPPGSSGITGGIGYDFGYNSAAQIKADWSGYLPDAQVKRLQSVAGLKTAKAKAALARVRDIRIPWNVAVAVYQAKTVPRFAKITESTYPGLLQTHPHIQGVMLSTTFNRGSSFSPYERRKELVWCRDDIRARKTAKLSSYHLQMRRLWPNIAGLQKRYAAHAALLDKAK